MTTPKAKTCFLVAMLLALVACVSGAKDQQPGKPELPKNPFPQADLPNIWGWFNRAGKGKSIAVAGDVYDRNLTIMTSGQEEQELTYAFDCKGNCTAAREKVNKVFNIPPSRRGTISEVEDPVGGEQGDRMLQGSPPQCFARALSGCWIFKVNLVHESKITVNGMSAGFDFYPDVYVHFIGPYATTYCCWWMYVPHVKRRASVLVEDQLSPWSGYKSHDAGGYNIFCGQHTWHCNP